MEELFLFYPSSTLRHPSKFPFLVPRTPKPSQNAPRPRPSLPTRGLSLSVPTLVSLPEKPPKFSSLSPAAEKLVFLESLGIDPFSYRPILSIPLSDLKSTVDFLLSLSFSSPEIRRIAGMCPEILASSPSDLAHAITFLLREAGVAGRDLRHVINRRPRLLVSSVAGRLRPTLYFLQMLGISHVARHTDLLSCSVEEKLIPRLEFLERSGFSSREARAMVRRFPQLFCYSIEENLRPKLRFLLEKMERGLEEVREFPQYFSFSLEKRIRPRHIACVEKKVVLMLPALLRPKDEEFAYRLEVCVSSSPPMRCSPLFQ
ncbi:mTERF domain-containing protein mitochondrial protein [Dioscorea alata]|uniref:mTERF domain-containing protein mitochondrial protein n=1 Tax=Dioscorea alata TaxID=55571 RepID=A0ACB7US02_DIOAL|nr:mTERF domain-containing protein mitochondrial protein [Dioscorea alata]